MDEEGRRASGCEGDGAVEGAGGAARMDCGGERAAKRPRCEECDSQGVPEVLLAELIARDIHSGDREQAHTSAIDELLAAAASVATVGCGEPSMLPTDESAFEPFLPTVSEGTEPSTDRSSDSGSLKLTEAMIERVTGDNAPCQPAVGELDRLELVHSPAEAATKVDQTTADECALGFLECPQCFCYLCHATVSKCRDWATHSIAMMDNKLWQSRHRATRTLHLHLLTYDLRRLHLSLCQEVIPFCSSNQRYDAQHRAAFAEVLRRVEHCLIHPLHAQLVPAFLLQVVELATVDTVCMVKDVLVDAMLHPELRSALLWGGFPTLLQLSLQAKGKGCAELCDLVNFLHCACRSSSAASSPAAWVLSAAASADACSALSSGESGEALVAERMASVLTNIDTTELQSWLQSLASTSLPARIFASCVATEQRLVALERTLWPLKMLWHTLRPADLSAALDKAQIASAQLARAALVVLTHMFAEDAKAELVAKMSALLRALLLRHLGALPVEDCTVDALQLHIEGVRGLYTAACWDFKGRFADSVEALYASDEVATGRDNLGLAALAVTLVLLAACKCPNTRVAGALMSEVLAGAPAPVTGLLVRCLSRLRSVDGTRGLELAQRAALRLALSPLVRPESLGLARDAVLTLPIVHFDDQRPKTFMLSCHDLTKPWPLCALENPIVQGSLRGRNCGEMWETLLRMEADQDQPITACNLLGVRLSAALLPDLLAALCDHLQAELATGGEVAVVLARFAEDQAVAVAVAWKALALQVFLPSSDTSPSARAAGSRKVVFESCVDHLRASQLEPMLGALVEQASLAEWVDARGALLFAFLHACHMLHRVAASSLIECATQVVGAFRAQLDAFLQANGSYALALRALYLRSIPTDAANPGCSVASLIVSVWTPLLVDFAWERLAVDPGLDPILATITGPVWTNGVTFAPFLDEAHLPATLRRLCTLQLSPVVANSAAFAARLVSIGSQLAALPQTAATQQALLTYCNEAMVVTDDGARDSLLVRIITGMRLADAAVLARCSLPLVCGVLGAAQVRSADERAAVTSVVGHIIQAAQQVLAKPARRTAHGLRVLGLTFAFTGRWELFLARWEGSVSRCLAETVGSVSLVDQRAYVLQLLLYCPVELVASLVTHLLPFLRMLYASPLALPAALIAVIRHASSELLFMHYCTYDQLQCLTGRSRASAILWLEGLSTCADVGGAGSSDLSLPLDSRALSWRSYIALVLAGGGLVSLVSLMSRWLLHDYVPRSIIANLQGFVEGLLAVCHNNTLRASENARRCLLLLLAQGFRADGRLQRLLRARLVEAVPKAWVEPALPNDGGKNARKRTGVVSGQELEDAKLMLRRILSDA